MLDGKRILITGGTGSLGTALVQRLLTGEVGMSHSITVYSRDEAKQHGMRLKYLHDNLHFMLGDVRDYQRLRMALHDIDVVFNTAALKHVDTCQNNPAEAIKTNIIGTLNLVTAIQDFQLSIETVVGVSSDKGVHPVNIYGATKFLQEALTLHANVDCPNTRFVSVCYGNVMASRGSVIPVFQGQISVTIIGIQNEVQCANRLYYVCYKSLLIGLQEHPA